MSAATRAAALASLEGALAELDAVEALVASSVPPPAPHDDDRAALRVGRAEAYELRVLTGAYETSRRRAAQRHDAGERRCNRRVCGLIIAAAGAPFAVGIVQGWPL